MKCSACCKNDCCGKYEYRFLCKGEEEKVECSCSCQVSPRDSFRQKSLSIIGGVVTVAGGIYVTAVSSAFLAVAAGAAIVGGGSNLILNPIQKTFTNERMSLQEIKQDVLLGGTIGAITGPIGAQGSSFASKATGLLKLGYRALTGTAAGVVSGAVGEGARYMRGEEVTFNSVTKAIGMGATVGAIGGSSSHFASSASGLASSEVSQAATRISVQSVSAAATDVSLQLYQNGTVDLKQTMVNTTGQFVIGVTAEASSAGVQRTNAYANKVNDQLIDEDAKRRNLTPEQTKELKENMRNLNKNSKENNAHELKDRGNSKRGGQVAADVGPKNDDGGRGAGRVIGEKVKGKFIYVDHTADHDYKGCRETVKGRLQDPIESLRTAKVEDMMEIVELIEEEEDKIKFE